MFEGNLTDTGFTKAAESPVLQPLEWPVLVARLAAARDLRGVFARRKMSGGGNFASFSTEQSANLNEIGFGINPDTLADCKTHEAKMSPAAQDAETGDREL
ncbi:hypothetical protein QWY75_12230 [Pontixanthobacter aestiaquae]|uniref:Uncharacterized protein n=1 Tax=Pontixanthobacter aestiaquae TaxID=1509367 RepID=A0A844Z4M2_9SPHN|nr:hypothetical protein [Pontixanthobacter aestiaquae]MDN3646972.1 hypothetical protein [Pontixanthobacter aestiaquae]MXO82047.1 hypothetical protein [Pontixanthobacter aestiaquae]